MSLTSQKVHSANTNGFIETVSFKVLHCGNVEGNNNKFYCLEKQKNPSTNEYRLFTHYGRLGKTNTYEIRGPASETEVEKEFNRILNQKLKSRKDSASGIEYNYEEVQTFSPTVGSDNIRSKSISIASKSFSPDFNSLNLDKYASRIVKQVYEENIHNITTMTNIRMTSSGLETPLGPVTKEHIQNARSVLNNVQNETSRTDEFKKLNSKYYSMIPHPFGHKIPDNAWLDNGNLADEFDLLDQLESAIKINTAKTNDTKLDFEIKHVDSTPDFKSFYKLFESTRAHNHSNLSNWKVKNVYTLNLPKVSNRFNSIGSKLNPIKTLFHGSRNCNVLSILLNGLIIPPCNANHVTGRMFGNGIYAASASTKALNYSTGYWNNAKNKHPNAFLFLVNFGMGKVYETSRQIQGPIKGYDSVWAKAGSSLHNDEFIVYNVGQVNITHLIELEK